MPDIGGHTHEGPRELGTQEEINNETSILQTTHLSSSLLII